MSHDCGVKVHLQPPMHVTKMIAKDPPQYSMTSANADPIQGIMALQSGMPFFAGHGASEIMVKSGIVDVSISHLNVIVLLVGADAASSRSTGCHG